MSALDCIWAGLSVLGLIAAIWFACDDVDRGRR